MTRLIGCYEVIFKGASLIRDLPHPWEVAEPIPCGYGGGGGITVLLTCVRIGFAAIRISFCNFYSFFSQKSTTLVK